MNMEVHTSLKPNTESFGHVSRSAVAESHRRTIFGVLINFYTCLHSGWTCLHSHQQGIPIFLSSLAFVKSFDGLIIIILVGVTWNLKTALIWIFLMAKGVKHILKLDLLTTNHSRAKVSLNSIYLYMYEECLQIQQRLLDDRQIV